MKLLRNITENRVGRELLIHAQIMERVNELLANFRAMIVIMI